MHVSVLILDQASARLEIRLHHFLDERVKIDVALPAEYPLSFGGPTQELSTNGHVEFKAERWIDTHSTSAGRKYLGSTRTTIFPV